MSLVFGYYAADIVEFYAMKIIDYKCIKHMKYALHPSRQLI